MKKRKRKKIKKSYILLYISLFLFCIIVIAPLIIVLSNSLRSPGNIESPLKIFSQFSLDSYKAAFSIMKYPSTLINTAISTTISVVVVIFVSSMAAYPISRVRRKLSKGLYYFFVAGLVVPSQMVIIPLTKLFAFLNIPAGQYTSIIMFITCSLPFSIFLFTGFMKSVPVEIEEAAYLDGAGLFRRYFKIVFPILKPATISVAITQGIWIWNDYFYPMVFSAKSSLAVSMLQFQNSSQQPAQYNIMFAACILSALPIIIMFVLLQKHFITGIAGGAVKG